MTAYFTDTFPMTLAILNSHTLYDGQKMVEELNKNISLPAKTSITWDVTDIDSETAHLWCFSHDFVAVLLKGAQSMTDFKNNFLGNEDSFAKPPNRLKGDPIVLAPEDICLVMDRPEVNDKLQWKLINNIRRA